MACRCKQHKTNNELNEELIKTTSFKNERTYYSTLPDEQCDICAEKHFSTAKRLSEEFGYVAINRQDIIGELSAATWHVYRQNIYIAEKIRDLRHKIQARQIPESKEWQDICFDFEELLGYRIEQHLCSGEIFSGFNGKIWIISNCDYNEDKTIPVSKNDILIFINKAKSLHFYKKYLHKAVFHRYQEESYGNEEDKSAEHYYCFKTKKGVFIPNDIIDEINKNYDWNYEIEENKKKSATTGYLVVKYLEKTFPNANLILVNFGFDVKESSYRCPWHNWEFEDKELEKFEHFYTNKKPTNKDKKRIFYELSGWMGDNVYASAVVENIVNTGKFSVNVSTPHTELWENCPNIDKTITRENSDLIIKQHNLYDWNNKTPHIIEGVTDRVSRDVGFKIPVVSKVPKIYMELNEERIIEKPYVLINTGWQNSAETKRWSQLYWKQLIDSCQNIVFVQFGQSKNHAIPIEGAINMIDKTDIHDLARLVRDADCVISPPSGVLHIAGAFGIPYINLSGGREPASLINYSCGTAISTCGKLECCKNGGCHKNHFSGNNACEKFVKLDGDKLEIGNCMSMITPEIVKEHIFKILKIEKN